VPRSRRCCERPPRLQKKKKNLPSTSVLVCQCQCCCHRRRGRAHLLSFLRRQDTCAGTGRQLQCLPPPAPPPHSRFHAHQVPPPHVASFSQRPAPSTLPLFCRGARRRAPVAAARVPPHAASDNQYGCRCPARKLCAPLRRRRYACIRYRRFPSLALSRCIYIFHGT